MAAKRKRELEVEVVGLVGIGFDHDDGHRRVSTGENFVLLGGSEATHERMIDTAVQVNEELRRKGKRLADAAPGELEDLIRKARDQ